MRALAAVMFSLTLVVWLSLVMLGWVYAGPRRFIRKLRLLKVVG